MIVQPPIALLPKILKVVSVVGHIKMRQLCFAKFKGNITPVCYKLCILYSLRSSRKQCKHFFLSFYIKLIGLKFHFITVVYCVIGLNTKQNFVGLTVCFFYIVTVVCCRQRDSGFFRKADYLRQNHKLFFYIVILNFQKIITAAEKLIIIICGFFGFGIVALQKIPGYFTGKAGRKTDYTLVVFL